MSILNLECITCKRVGCKGRSKCFLGFHKRFGASSAKICLKVLCKCALASSALDQLLFDIVYAHAILKEFNDAASR